MAEATVKPAVRARGFTPAHLEDVLETVQRVADIAEQAPGLWIDRGTLVLSEATQAGPGGQMGTVHIHTDDQENVEVIFEPYVDGL